MVRQMAGPSRPIRARNEDERQRMAHDAQAFSSLQKRENQLMQAARKPGLTGQPLRVEVKRGKGHVRHGRGRGWRGGDEAAVNLLINFLKYAGCSDTFRAQSTHRFPRTATGAAPGVKIVEHTVHAILVSIQPTDIESRQSYWLTPPPHYRITDLFNRLREISARVDIRELMKEGKVDIATKPASTIPTASVLPRRPEERSLVVATSSGPVVVEIKHQHKPATDIPSGMQELIGSFLEDHGCRGRYVLQVNAQTVKSDPPKGRGVWVLEVAMRTILLVAQPDEAESRRFYWLMSPPEQDTLVLFNRLREVSRQIVASEPSPALKRQEKTALSGLQDEDWDTLKSRLRLLVGEDELYLHYQQGQIYEEIWRRWRGDGLNRISEELGLSMKHIFEVLRFAQTFTPDTWIPILPYRHHAIIAWHYQLAFMREPRFAEGRTPHEWLILANKQGWDELAELEARVSFYYGTVVVTGGMKEDLRERLATGSGWDTHPLARAEFLALSERAGVAEQQERTFIAGIAAEAQGKTKAVILAKLEDLRDRLESELQKRGFKGFKLFVREKP
jgi:hypothetical protein